MKYTNDQYAAMVAEVERQRGALLPDACVGREIAYKIRGRRAPLRTTECRNTTRVVVNYDCGSDEIQSRGGGFATVCLVDDNVGLWPRFKEAYRGA